MRFRRVTIVGKFPIMALDSANLSRHKLREPVRKSK
ncbi:MAG: hypothetical protein JWO91_3489 [Acidobacteriaceae bacterium]|jgi:hypothetical protein|nr:hypothetical protein [Acidobacteriaceae bacterium]